MAVAIGTTPSSPCRATTGHRRSGHGVDGVTPWYWPCASRCHCRCHCCMVVATSLLSPSLSCAGGHTFGATVSSWHWPRMFRRRCCVLVATALPPSSPLLRAGCHSTAAVFAVAACWLPQHCRRLRRRCVVVAASLLPSSHRSRCVLVATALPSSSPSLCGGSHFVDVVAVAAWWWQRRYCRCRHRCAVVATTPRTSRRRRRHDAMALATHAPSSSS